jgi:hypothetical protein
VVGLSEGGVEQWMTHRRMVRTARLQVDMESFFLNWHQQELRHQELTCTEPRWLWRLKPGLPEGRDSAIIRLWRGKWRPDHLKGGGERIRPAEAARQPENGKDKIFGQNRWIEVELLSPPSTRPPLSGDLLPTLQGQYLSP